MLTRDLPRFADLRAFTAHLDTAGQSRRIAEPVSVVHEVTEIHRRVIAGNGPALLFERPVRPDGTISPVPLLTNLFGTVERVAWGLGIEPGQLRALGLRRQFPEVVDVWLPPEAIALLGFDRDDLPIGE